MRAERIGHRSLAKLARVSSAGVETLRIELLPRPVTDHAADASVAASWYAEQPVAAARAMAAALACVRPPGRSWDHLGDASRACWTDDALAEQHEELLAWRDHLFAERFPPRVR